MKKTLIIYHSKTGTTKKYAEEIAAYLEEKGVQTQVTTTSMYSNEMLKGASHILFGCWTSGLFFVLQKPEKAWVSFAARLDSQPEAKVGLFTTYKILTGSMFANMVKVLDGKFQRPVLELKSKNALVSDADRQALDQFIGD